MVPDNSISTATSILLDAWLFKCSKYTSCWIADANFRPSPAPASHVHLDQDISLRQFKLSETLWRVDLSSLPQLEQVVIAEGERLGTEDGQLEEWMRISCVAALCAVPSDWPMSASPTGGHLVQAYILLIVRDRRKVYQLLVSDAGIYAPLCRRQWSDRARRSRTVVSGF